MIIARERQRMGWLNPYARPFIPETNHKNQDPVTNTKITKEGAHRRTASEPKPQTNTPKKHPRIQKILSSSPTIRKQAQGKFATNWIKEGKVFRKQNTITPTRPNTKIKHNNRYKVLEDNEEVEHDNVVVPQIITDIKLEETVKDRNRLQQTIEQVNEQYEVETMTVKAVEALLLQHHMRAEEESESNKKIIYESQNMKDKVTKLEQHITTLSNTHQIIVCDLQSENNQQSEIIRSKEKTINATQNECNMLADQIQQLKEMKEREVEKLKKEVEETTEEMNKWKEKHKKAEYSLGVNEWIENKMDEEEKLKMRRYVQNAKGSKGEERRNRSRYKGKRPSHE